MEQQQEHGHCFPPVAFTAVRAVRGRTDRLRFQRSLTNTGGRWDGETFRAGQAGTYSFSWAALR